MKKLKNIIFKLLFKKELNIMLSERCYEFEKTEKTKGDVLNYHLGRKSGIEFTLYQLTGESC